MKKVLIATKLDGVAQELLTANGRYEVVSDCSTDLADLCATYPDTYALIVRSEPVTAEIIDSLPGLKVVIRAGAGYNTIDCKHARKRGVDVMNTPGANANAVAEEVLAMVLADMRRIMPADASCRAGKWEKRKFMGRELAGKTVGLVGLGNIGQMVVRRLAGFEVRLLGCDPVIAPERAAALGVDLVTLPELFAQADVISFHVPENEQTQNMVASDLLQYCKDGAIIVNCARSGLINESDLRVAKAQKGIRFLNDVYEKDAPGPKSVADICDLMLPHLGASTREANIAAARRAAEELIELDEKGVTSYIVNRDIPEGLDESFCELANLLSRLCLKLSPSQGKPQRIETSFYGQLQPYANWLLVPVVAALFDDFDRSLSYGEALRYLQEMGIEYIDRETDPAKGYESSITIDLLSSHSSRALQKVSVRGTVAERRLMVTRIDEFDNLFFEPHGHSVYFMYDDRPGILGKIGLALAASGINIEDVRNPHDARTNRSLAIMKVNKRVPAEVMQAISGEIDALAAFRVEL